MSRKSMLLIFISAFCFGTMEIALKLGGGSFTALQITFLRFLVGGLFLLPFALKDKKKRNLHLTWKDFLILALFGGVGICLGMTSFQMGLMSCNANTAAIIMSTNPVYVAVLAYFIVGEKFNVRKGIVLAISMVGLVLVANPFQLAEGNTVKGILLAFLGAVCFALYSTLGKLTIDRLGGYIQNCFCFLIAAAMELVILLIRGEPVFSGITWGTLPTVLYAGIVVSGIGYLTYLDAVRDAGPTNAAFTFFIKPIIAVICAALILKETITWNIVLGIILILSGSFINNIRLPKKQHEDR